MKTVHTTVITLVLGLAVPEGITALHPACTEVLRLPPVLQLAINTFLLLLLLTVMHHLKAILETTGRTITLLAETLVDTGGRHLLTIRTTTLQELIVACHHPLVDLEDLPVTVEALKNIYSHRVNHI